MAAMRAQFVIILLLAMPTALWGDPICSGSGADFQCTAESVCKADVEAAVDLVEANGGGMVNIPEGDTNTEACNWTGNAVSYLANGSISIVGAGKAKTILRSSGTSLYGWFAINNSNLDYAIPRIAFKGFSIIGKVAGSAPVLLWGGGELVWGYMYMETEDSGSAGTICLKAVRKGVIYSSEFVESDDGVTSCNNFDSYGFTPATLYSPYPQPSEKCYSSTCTCTAGSRAVYRSSSIPAGNTVIARMDRTSSGSANINNAGGSGSGTVQEIYIYIASVGSSPTVDLASFSASGNVMTTNGAATGIPVEQGHNWLRAGKDFTAFDIEHGEYIGAYLNDCAIAAGMSRSDGGTSASAHWIKAGDYIPASSEDFGAAAPNNVSLWVGIHDDEGDMASCENAWDNYWTSSTLNRGGGYFDMPQDHTWKPTATDDEAIFVEDCLFRWWYAANEGNWGSNARVVFRKNRFVLPTSLSSACPDNASRITMKPGGNFAHIYDNWFEYYSFTHDTIAFDAAAQTISFTADAAGLWDFRDVFAATDTITVMGSTSNDGNLTVATVGKTSLTVNESVTDEPAGNLINLRVHGLGRYKTLLYISTDALIYDNTFSGAAYAISPIMYQQYSDWVFTPQARPHHVQMWSNDYFNMWCGGSGDAGGDTWDCAKPYQAGIANGQHPLEFAAPVSGKTMYGFEAYTYPHPLRGDDPGDGSDGPGDGSDGPGDGSDGPGGDSDGQNSDGSGCYIRTLRFK